LPFIFKNKIINQNYCTVCLLPLISRTSPYCAECITEPKYFNSVKSPFLYEEPVSALIQNFKFHKDLGAGKYLSQFLLNFLKQDFLKQDFLKQDLLERPDLIIPVPLHIKKLKRRGFNQSILVAKWLSKVLKIPINLKIIKRYKVTPPQLFLNRKERLKNLKNAFELINKDKFKKLEIRHVALIDDVMTTGATVNEISRVLKQAGVEKVEIWCLARAIHRFSDGS
jgi:ComF family protein